MLKELEKAGYLSRIRRRDEKGRLTKSDWVVRPKKEANPSDTKGLSPQPEKPDEENPHEVKPQLQIKEINKEIDKTTRTSARRGKIELKVFVDRVEEAMIDSPVPIWFAREAAAELWEEYSHPRTSHAIKIIYDDWEALNKQKRKSSA